MGEVTLETVFERLGARPGVEGVTLATLEGLVVHSSLEGAAGGREARHFGRMLAALQEGWESVDEQMPELVTVRSAGREYVLTMADQVHGGPEKSDYFFIVVRNPKTMQQPKKE